MINAQDVTTLTTFDRAAQAIRENDVPTLTALLENLPDMNYADLIPLIWCPWSGRTSREDIMEIVVRAFIKIISGTDEPQKALVAALTTIQVKTQREKGANTSLHTAAQLNSLKVVTLLLDGGAGSFAKNAAGQKAIDLTNDPDIKTCLEKRMAEEQEPLRREISESRNLSGFLSCLPRAVDLEMTGELQAMFSRAIKTQPELHQEIVTNDENTGKSGLHVLAVAQAPLLLEWVLQSCPKLDVNHGDDRDMTALEIAALWGDLESVVLLTGHGASITPKLIETIASRLTNKTSSMRHQDKLLLVSVMQYLLHRPQSLLVTPRQADPAGPSLTFKTHHVFTPRTAFKHREDYDELVHGNTQMDGGHRTSLFNLFRAKPRESFRSLVDELNIYTQVPQITLRNAGLLERVQSANDGSSVAGKLMMAFNILARIRTELNLETVRLITGLDGLQEDQYDEVVAQYRLAWKDFIILVKTNEIFARDVACEKQGNPGFKINDEPWLSLQAIEKAQGGKHRHTRETNRARLGHAALQEAHAWYDGFDHQLTAEINNSRKALYAKAATACHQVPNLEEELCRRTLLNKADLKTGDTWCTLFHREHLPAPVADLTPSSSSMAASSSSRF